MYTPVYAAVTAGSVNPAAIYVIRTIYNPTNNVVPIKYVNKISNHIYNTHINVCLQNLSYTFSLLAAIHLFISSHNEIEDFCSMDKLMRRDVKALTRAFWFDKIKNTMVGLIQRRPTIFRRQEKWVVDVNCVPRRYKFCTLVHKNNIFKFSHSHYVILTSYKIITIYNSTYQCVSSRT